MAVIQFEKKPTKTKGGARPGSGRKKGSPNKKTAKLQAEVEASGITPLDYMLKIMRDETGDPKERLSAAVSAAPYVHPRLSSVDMKATVKTHESALDDLA